ncbi:Uncharacterised protein [Amycolatopsis camponoti]|uniref:L-lysine epsilon oxidase C-terminal domain-containing protein n=1 Tax=Amycolatopsis camponoti TaxID=2606593 RepID=A0A6I8M4W3_9PSEU|nr:Uncharacterised protein [Amycolatopsis camponoti]
MRDWVTAGKTDGSWNAAWVDGPPVSKHFTPDGMDKAALENCVGGALRPGIEAGELLLDPARYGPIETPDGAAGRLAALAATTHVRQFVRGRAGSPVRVVTAAGHRLRPGAAGPGWLAVGDAAFATDPLSSGGVTCALRMATAAADALTDGDRAHYLALVDGMAADYFARYSEIYGWERRFPGSEFWRARLPGVTNSTTSPEPRRPPAASRRSCSSGTGPRSRPES